MTMQAKPKTKTAESTFAGIDVGAEELILVIRKNSTAYKSQTFTNTPADRVRLVKKLVGIHGVIVCLEATGVYHFDLSIALHDAGVALMVVNPKASHNFAKVLMRPQGSSPQNIPAKAGYSCLKEQQDRCCGCRNAGAIRRANGFRCMVETR